MFRSDALGSYCFGSFFSRTIFPRGFETYAIAGKYLFLEPLENGSVKVQKKHIHTHEDTLAAVTYIHELVHYLQDLTTGYGHFLSSNARILLSTFKKFFLRIGAEEIVIPLTEWEVENTDDRLLLTKLKGELSAFPQLLNQFNAEGSILDETRRKTHLPRSDGRSILEGMAFCISERFVARQLKIAKELRYNVKEAMNLLDLTNYSPIYSKARRQFEYFVKPHLKGSTENEKYQLFILLCDLALGIPSIRDMLSLEREQKLKREDSIPGYRFVKASRVIRRTPRYFRGDIFEKYETLADEICTQLNWLSLKETNESLIDALKRQKRTWKDFAINMQIRATKAKMNNPSLFLEPIWEVLGKAKIVITYFTPTEPRWLMFPSKDDSILGSSYESSDAHKSLIYVFHRIFLDSIVWQLFRSHRIICPFLEFPFKCPKEREECSTGINTQDEYYADGCAVCDGLKNHFALELKNLHYLHDSF